MFASLYYDEFTGVMPEEVCALRRLSLIELVADCAGEIPKVECDCCTKCTDGITDDDTP